MRVFLAILGAAALLTGCTRSTIEHSGAEQSVADLVAQRTGFRPTDVRCPSGVEAKVGRTFDCYFTGRETKPYVAHVRILKIDGQRVEFFVTTQPVG